jgi:hypothetical protein
MGAQTIIAVIALITSLLASAVAILQTRRISRISRMPILVITYDGSVERWVVRNVGNGPALNIVVAQQAEDESLAWYNPVLIPAVGSGEAFTLDWLGTAGDFSLGARYCDFLDRDHQSNHFTYTHDDRCTVYAAHRQPSWIMPSYPSDQVERHWREGLSWRRTTTPLDLTDGVEEGTPEAHADQPVRPPGVEAASARTDQADGVREAGPHLDGQSPIDPG